MGLFSGATRLSGWSQIGDWLRDRNDEMLTMKSVVLIGLTSVLVASLISLKHLPISFFG